MCKDTKMLIGSILLSITVMSVAYVILATLIMLLGLDNETSGLVLSVAYCHVGPLSGCLCYLFILMVFS